MISISFRHCESQTGDAGCHYTCFAQPQDAAVVLLHCLPSHLFQKWIYQIVSFHRCARDNRDQDSFVSAIADLFYQRKRGLLGVSDVQQSKSQGWPRPPPALSTSTLFGAALKDRQHPVSYSLKRRDTREMAILHCKKKWAYKAVSREKRERKILGRAQLGILDASVTWLWSRLTSVAPLRKEGVEG